MPCNGLFTISNYLASAFAGGFFLQKKAHFGEVGTNPANKTNRVRSFSQNLNEEDNHSHSQSKPLVTLWIKAAYLRGLFHLLRQNVIYSVLCR